MIVIIRGPLLSVTGYGVHTRQVWQWARSKKGWEVYASITPWGNCTYNINPAIEDGLIGDIMSRTSPLPNNADLSLQVQLPDEWDPNLAKKNIGITAGIEADRCNPSWISACAKMDKVIVPSEYSKLSFINGGVDPSLIVNVPEAITCGSKENKSTKALNNMLDMLPTDFNFLMFGQITSGNADADRKNTFNCLKWMCEEFSNNKDVGIVIKTNMGRLHCEDRRHTENMVSSALSQVRKGDYPRVYVVHGLMDTDEIGALYRHKKVKALCAPTRGEGWGLPLLDAASCGLPVIATGYSGHVDFLRYTKYLDVRYKLEKIPDSLVDERIWVSGARWAQPDEKHFKSRIKKFKNSPDIPTEWFEESKDKINEMFSLPSVLKHYDAQIGELID